MSHLRALPKNLRFISEDGKGVRESKVMYEAMCIAAQKGLTVMSHAEDMDLSATDYRLAENLETARNLYLAASTGAKLHMCHVSTKEALELSLIHILCAQPFRGPACRACSRHALRLSLIHIWAILWQAWARLQARYPTRPILRKKAIWRKMQI